MGSPIIMQGPQGKVEVHPEDFVKSLGAGYSPVDGVVMTNRAGKAVLVDHADAAKAINSGEYSIGQPAVAKHEKPKTGNMFDVAGEILSKVREGARASKDYIQSEAQSLDPSQVHFSLADTTAPQERAAQSKPGQQSRMFINRPSHQQLRLEPRCWKASMSRKTLQRSDCSRPSRASGRDRAC
jgi:hypothetical protein